jgi:hypothetical protein
MRKKITNARGETLVEKGTEREASKIADFARRPVFWGEKMIGSEYAPKV